LQTRRKPWLDRERIAPSECRFRVDSDTSFEPDAHGDAKAGNAVSNFDSNADAFTETYGNADRDTHGDSSTRDSDTNTLGNANTWRLHG
jgi:hypothetical protein